MATQAQREKARRLAVEKAFVKPEPRHDWADAAPSDRTPTVANIVKAAEALGWIIEEKTRLDWHPPTWVTDPDGGAATYKAKPRVQYHLYAHVPTLHGQQALGGIDLLMVDGRKVRLRLGWGHLTVWTISAETALTSVAKLIREEGIPS